MTASGRTPARSQSRSQGCARPVAKNFFTHPSPFLPTHPTVRKKMMSGDIDLLSTFLTYPFLHVLKRETVGCLSRSTRTNCSLPMDADSLEAFERARTLLDRNEHLDDDVPPASPARGSQKKAVPPLRSSALRRHRGCLSRRFHNEEVALTVKGYVSVTTDHLCSPLD